jgi:hypothetical protein
MLRVALFATCAALLTPAAASAAPFGELPFQPFAGGVSCLRATGAPGELAAWAPDGIRFLHATPTGLAPAGSVRLGPPSDCPVVAAQPNGAGVAAAGVVTRTAIDLAVALREPGGGWGVPAVTRQPEGAAVTDLGAAVSEAGDAVVIWRDLRLSGREVVSRVRAIRRRAGGRFGQPETLDDTGTLDFGGTVAAGVAADGSVVALWSRTKIKGRSVASLAMSSIAAPGAPFGAPVRLASGLAGPVALAVAPDGRALAALNRERDFAVAERAPGGAFGAVEKIGEGALSFNAPAVALRPDGAALIAWGGDALSGVTAVRRSGPGAFGPPVEVVATHLHTGEFGRSSASVGFAVEGGAAPQRPDDSAGGALRAVLAPDGRAVITWADPQTRAGIAWSAARVATLGADATAATQVLGGPLRDAATVAPALLDSGAPVVAWGDNARPGSGDGRLHLALEGAAAPAPAAFPRVAVGRPERTVLRSRQSLVLPVTCSAACDVRGEIGEQAATASLPAAGRTRLDFGAGSGREVPVRPAHVRIRVASGPPGAVTAQTQVVRPLLRRIPDPPMPRLLGLRATRNGSTVDVRWHTDRASTHVRFIVVATTARHEEGDFLSSGTAKGGKRRSFHVRIRDVPAKARYVEVAALRETDGHFREATARIR